MLYSFVKNYLNERGTFNTEVCQYSFGMGVADPALSELDTQIEAKETISNEFELAMSKRKSTVTDNGTTNTNLTTNMAKTALSVQRGFGMGLGMGSTTLGGQFFKYSEKNASITVQDVKKGRSIPGDASI